MGQKSTLLAIGLIIFAVILTILFIVSRVVGSSKNEVSKKDTEATQNIQNLVPVNKIIGTPIVYEGYNVTVESEVSGWTTNKSFYFSAEQSGILGGGSRGILIAIADDALQLPQDPSDDKLGLGETSPVIASGTVRILSREELQTALGIDLDDPKVALNNDIISKWNLGPVLILDSVVITTK